MQYEINYGEVLDFNRAQPAIETRSIKIGKWEVTLEAFKDFYDTINVRIGVNGETPTFYGASRMKTNGIGQARLIKEVNEFIETFNKTD